MSLVLDAGALIAIDRRNSLVEELVAKAHRLGLKVITTAPVVGQVWRGGSLQARLARALTTIDVRPVELTDAKEAGALLGRSRTSDVVDACMALLVEPGDEVLTSDPGDVALLLRCRRVPAEIKAV